MLKHPSPTWTAAPRPPQPASGGSPHKEENLYVAECPEVGTVSQGYTVEEAVANLKEATELYLVETGIVEEDVRTSLEQVKGLIEKLRAKVSER